MEVVGFMGVPDFSFLGIDFWPAEEEEVEVLIGISGDLSFSIVTPSNLLVKLSISVSRQMKRRTPEKLTG